MTDDKKNDEVPDKFKSKAGQTAVDERDGKAVRGHENIDKHGHKQGYGDDEDERDAENGL